uniref:HTH OST-type domain-containing protein n=2 Tax=Noccaea caerulescens TaxID=107243 RepID=A0A1J3EZE4_NOCCA
MQFRSSKYLFLRLAGSSFPEHPPSQSPRRAISVLVANFSSSNIVSGSSSGQFTSRRPQKDDESRGVRVSVWWSFDNCNLPAGANVFKVAQTITAAVRINGIKGPIKISAFGDVLQLSRTKQEALYDTGISLTHVPQGEKNSTGMSMITDLMCWVAQNPPPAHLFLISSDGGFASVLHKLRMNNYNILLAGDEEMTPGVLCSAASIMWDWNDLALGKHSTCKHFNQPPDGPYDSWYGHYRTPLLDPFATSSTTTTITTKQQSCTTSVKTEEVQETNSNPISGSSKVCRPIPKEVVEQIGLVLSLYPKGAAITDLREQLRKRNVSLDKDFYGHKSFSRFLLSMPEILQVVPKGDGMFLVHAWNQRMDSKASSPKLSSEDPKVVLSVEKRHQKVKQNVEDVRKESQSQESSQESVPVVSQMNVEAKEETVKETQLALTPGDDVSSSDEKDGFFKKLNRLWFGSPEIVSEGRVVDKDLESRISSSTTSESAKEVKTDTEVGNEKSKSPGLLNRLVKRFKFFWGRNTELSNAAAATEAQVDDIFAKYSFWKDVESFIYSPRGFVVVSHSKSREALAKNLKDEGPSSLKPLDVSKLLALVSMLVSEKKWIKENPYDALPFRVTQFTGKGSGLNNNPSASSGLRSRFVNMSKSLCDEADDEKKVSKNIVGISEKPLKRSRSEVLEDCQKLIKKITEENPGGYNMGNFRKDFLEKFKYRLDYQNLGYPKLQSLIQIMPEARIESGFIVPSSTPVPYQSDSSFGELCPEPSVSEHENSVTVEAEEASLTLKQNGGERKKKKKDSESDLLQILDSRDNDEDVEKSYAFGEDKLVDGILKSLRKNPSGESRIQG